MWPIMSEDEFARVEADSGNTVIVRGGIWWRRVRPLFYRPLLPFQPYGADALKGAFGPLTGFQHAVEEGRPFNSHFNLLIWDRLGEYCLQAVSQHTRSKIRKALENRIELARVENPDAFIEAAYPVYQSFLTRTRYGFLAERQDRKGFEDWARKLLSHPKLLVLAAVHEKRLVSIHISCRVGNVVVLKAAINSEAALGIHAPDLAIHHYREQASKIPDIRFLYDSFYQEHESVNTFKIRRGARVSAFPALLRMPPGSGTLFRTFLKNPYRQLIGLNPDAVRGIRSA
jgi:hypothetical protein